MKYITHNRFKKLAACGEAVNIPYGTEMETAGDFIITTEGKPICYATSEAAKMHFARNDDGQGLERGKLTWAIAYSQRCGPARTDGSSASQRRRSSCWNGNGHISCGRMWRSFCSTKTFSRRRCRS